MHSKAVNALGQAYLDALEFVIEAGYEEEVEWQRECSTPALSASSFLKEAAWVILSAGLAERIVRRKFPAISEAFFGWCCERCVLELATDCRARAVREFNHVGKIDAIVSAAAFVDNVGIPEIQVRLEAGDLRSFLTIPFIGPVTVHHLGKNLGVATAKSDRHLVRLSQLCHFNSPIELCRAIGDEIGDSPSVVDIVLWRYATLDRELLLFRRWLPT